MKRTILQFSITLVLFSMGFISLAQVTISEDNYYRLGNYTDSVFLAAQTASDYPVEGADQSWDYAFLTPAGISITDHFDGTTDEDFSGATGFYQNDLTFQGMIIASNVYESVNENGWQVLGHRTTEVSYPIISITGGANDTLSFPGKTYIYETPNELMQFPLTWESEWSNTFDDTIDFVLTVGAFGLNQVPGIRKRTITDTREIVGYGDLILPKSDGTASEPMQVLLMKSTRFVVDSVFLGGQIAPPPLMAAFGLYQGATATSEGYLFYRPGFGSAVLAVDDTGEITFRPQGADFYTGTNDMTGFLNSTVYPNPASPGTSITIETASDVSQGYATIMDVTGRVVSKSAYNSGSENQVQLILPDHLSNGLHFYSLHNLEGREVYNGKLQINR